MEAFLGIARTGGKDSCCGHAGNGILSDFWMDARIFESSQYADLFGNRFYDESLYDPFSD